MKAKIIHTKKDRKSFYRLAEDIYRDHPFYRDSESELAELLYKEGAAYRKHARVIPYLIRSDNEICGRFILTVDERQADLVYCAFFESKDMDYEPLDIIREEAQRQFPDSSRLVIGINGHLNYGAGIMQEEAESVPVFGLPYHPVYYTRFFSTLNKRELYSFRFPTLSTPAFRELAERYRQSNHVKIRLFRPDMWKEDIRLYTTLNNICFKLHPYWTERDAEEDMEMFASFRHLLQAENLIFAEINGETTGFLLWFPDFNQWIGRGKKLRASGPWSRDVLRLKRGKVPDTFRFAEIGVLPDYRKQGVELALIAKMVDEVVTRGYQYGEGGFIFNDNTGSINMATKYLERITGQAVISESHYAVYEGHL